MDPTLSTVTKKTLWRARKIWTFYCPNCKFLRRLPFQKNPFNFRVLCQLLLTTVILTGIFWKIFYWKGLFVFFPLWAFFELYHRLKVRSLMECPHCGFDPYLYSLDPQWARKQIETFWRNKLAEKGIPYPGDPNKNESAESTKGETVH